jgi:RES domain-containing protein
MASRPEGAFRIADRRRVIFDGTGAFLNGGRWNSPGRRVIYGAETFAGAILEVLVHTGIGKVPRTHSWVEIAIPPEVSIEELEQDAGLDARAFGDRWYGERRSLILLVPSVAASGLARNVLINQDHAEFSLLRASEPREVIWDARLFTPR